MWLIYFEDDEYDLEIYDDEEIAKKRYEELSERWIVHLFKEVIQTRKVAI